LDRREFIAASGGVIKWPFVKRTPRWHKLFAFITAD
jgi:hypothetical protein